MNRAEDHHTYVRTPSSRSSTKVSPRATAEKLAASIWSVFKQNWTTHKPSPANKFSMTKAYTTKKTKLETHK